MNAAKAIRAAKAHVKQRVSATSCRKVAEDTGVSEAWIRQLLAGEIQNPGVRTLERVYPGLFQ